MKMKKMNSKREGINAAGQYPYTVLWRMLVRILPFA
jgi:hypothetical protein